MRFLILLCITISVFLIACNPVEEINISEKYQCNTDGDCAINLVECKECSPMRECTNRDWRLDCDTSKFSGEVCPPAPLWVSTCRCINSKCSDCRDVFPVAEGKIECKVDNNKIEYSK